MPETARPPDASDCTDKYQHVDTSTRRIDPTFMCGAIIVVCSTRRSRTS